MGCSLQDKHAQAWTLHSLQFPSGNIYLLQRGVLHGLQFGYLFQRGLRGLQVNLCTGTWTTFSSSLSHLGFCRAVSHTFFVFSLLSLTDTVKCFAFS